MHTTVELTLIATAEIVALTVTLIAVWVALEIIGNVHFAKTLLIWLGLAKDKASEDNNRSSENGNSENGNTPQPGYRSHWKAISRVLKNWDPRKRNSKGATDTNLEKG